MLTRTPIERFKYTKYCSSVRCEYATLFDVELVNDVSPVALDASPPLPCAVVAAFLLPCDDAPPAPSLLSGIE